MSDIDRCFYAYYSTTLCVASRISYDLKKMVVGRELVGVRICWAFTCRAGMLPSLLLVTRMPRKAGDKPTVPIANTEST